MRKDKNTINSNEKNLPVMRVVETPADQTQLEFEIERHVKSIRALITRLRPVERQRYFDGLLSHILSQPVNYPAANSHQNDSYDYCNLSYDELALIRELSLKVHELYRVSEFDDQS